jgi:hypothetical protein
MFASQRLSDKCFQPLVAISQAFIAVVGGVAVAFALVSGPVTQYRPIAKASTTLADLLTLLFLADPGSAVRTSLRT